MEPYEYDGLTRHLTNLQAQIAEVLAEIHAQHLRTRSMLHQPVEEHEKLLQSMAHMMAGQHDIILHLTEANQRLTEANQRQGAANLRLETILSEHKALFERQAVFSQQLLLLIERVHDLDEAPEVEASEGDEGEDREPYFTPPTC